MIGNVIETLVVKIATDAKALAEGLAGAGKKLDGFGKSLSLKVTAPITAIGGLAAKAAIDFESAFAGVRKTVEATEQEFTMLEKGIREMAKTLPASAVDIAKVAESAGQLGIETSNILDFTKTMIDLGESTNLTAEQAATSFARFANITKMPQDNFSNLGSSVVALGNNFATTEAEIVSMGMRLAGTGAQVGLTEADIMGFATALSSVGIEAEMGGNAFSKLMIEMSLAAETGGGMLQEFAEVTGMSAQQFQKAFQEDAKGAIVSFLQGLNQMGLDGESVIKMLDDMGIKEVRLRDTILRAAGAADVFSEAVELSNKAWKENTALTNEANQRYATTASQLKIMRNNINELRMQFGEVMLPHIIKFTEKVKELTQKFQEMSPKTQENIIKFGLLAAAIGPVVGAIGSIISTVGGLMTAISTISGGIGVFTGATAAAGSGAAAFGGVLSALLGPIGLAIAGVAALTVGGVALYRHFKQELIPETEHFGDGVSEAAQKATQSFLDMNEQVSKDLTTLSITGQEITEDMKNSIVENISDMASGTKEAISNTRDDSIEAISKLFEASSGLSKKEKEEILENTKLAYDGKIKNIEDAEQEITNILESASEERRQLTEAEQKIISENRELISTEGIKHLTESELEQKVILERMSQNASVITARQSAEVVKNSIGQKEKVTAEAEAQYNSLLATIIEQRDVMGTISEEQANVMIQNAQMQRDKTIKSAEEMHRRIVEEAKLQANEHVKQINWETGEILTKWEAFKSNVAAKWNEIKENRRQRLDEMLEQERIKNEEIRRRNKEIWDNITTYIGTKYNEILEKVKSFGNTFKNSVSEKFEEAKQTVNNKLNEMEMFFKELPQKALNWGKNMIQGFTDGIKSMIGSVGSAVSSITSAVSDFLGFNSPARKGEGRNIVKWGYNMIQGFIDGIESAEPLLQSTLDKLMKNISDLGEETANKFKEAFQTTLKSLDTIGFALITALKNRYNEQKDILIKSLNAEVDEVRKAADLKIKEYDREYIEKLKVLDAEEYALVKSLQEQIDSIDNQTKAEQKALKEQEYQKRLADKYNELHTAESAEQIAKIKEEINKMIADKEREHLLEQRELQKNSLRQEIEAIRENYRGKKEEAKQLYEYNIQMAEQEQKNKLILLEQELEETKKQFEELLKEENLQAEARKLILEQNNDEIISLLNDYNPLWHDAGKSFGEKLLEGILGVKPKIEAVIGDIMSMVGMVYNISDSLNVGIGNIGAYTVKRGDTLSQLAKEFGTTVSELANLNNIKDVNKIYTGQTINIPSGYGNTSSVTNNNSFEGIFKGANLTVRNGQDIVTIAQTVAEIIKNETDNDNRGLGLGGV